MYYISYLFIACSDGRVDCVDFLCRVTPPEYLLWPASDDIPHEGNTPLHIGKYYILII